MNEEIDTDKIIEYVYKNMVEDNSNLVVKCLKEKDKEIKRLNNILNKIEKESYLGRKENEDKGNDYQNGLTAAYNYIYNRIQELKEGK